ncbi:MAG: hypothetical protein ACI4SE_01770 [Lachnospiraceae bacterium]
MKLVLLELKRIGNRRWVFLWFLFMLALGLWVSGLWLRREFQEEGCLPEEYLAVAERYDGMTVSEADAQLHTETEQWQQVASILSMYRMGILEYEEASERLSDCGYEEMDPDKIDVETVWQSLRSSQLVLRELDLLQQYDSYLMELKTGAAGLSNISFFREDIYIERTREKAMEDYAGLDVSVEVWHHNTAAREFLQNRIMDGFIFAFLLTVLLLLYTEEREKNFISLTGTALKGKNSFYFRKSAVMFVYTLVTVSVYECALLLFYLQKMGAVDWNAPIQSIVVFESCNKAYSILQTVILTVLFKSLFFFIFMLVLSVPACIITKNIYMIGIAAALTAVSVIWAKAGSLNTSQGWLTCFNPVNLLDSAELFTGYQNVRILQYPVSQRWITAGIVCGCFFMACIMGSCLYGRVSHGRTHSILSFFGKKEQDKVALKKKRERCFFHKPLFFLEMQKLLFSCRFLLPLLLIVIGFVAYFMNSSDLALSQQELFYQEYMSELNGPLTEEKEQFITEERQKFELLAELKEQALQQENQSILIDYIDKMMIKQEAFRIVEEEYIRLQEQEDVSVFLYETGYLYLFGIRQNEKSSTGILIGMLLLAIILPWFSWIEFRQGAITLVRTTEHGRLRRLFTQFGGYCVIAILIMGSVYLGDMISIFKQFGTYGLDQGLANMNGVQDITFPFSIGFYLLLIQMIRVFGIILLVLLTGAVMYLCRDYLKAALICCVFTVLPYLLFLNGFDFFNGYFLNAFLQGNELLLLIWNGETGKLIFILIQTLACLLASFKVLKREVKM